MKLVDVSDIFESEENRQDKLQELFEEMDRTAAICESLDNSIFPDFMWEPIQNEFEDDNYLERGVVDNEDMQAVRMLRRNRTITITLKLCRSTKTIWKRSLPNIHLISSLRTEFSSVSLKSLFHQNQS